MNSQHASAPIRFTRLLQAGIALGACLAASAAAPQALPSEAVPSLAPMLERVSPAVVNISVSGRVEIDNPLADDPFLRRFLDRGVIPDAREFQSAGSGVIVDAANGYVLTNNHVVENAEEITATLLDSRSMQATVIGADPGSDIALLQIAAEGLVEIGFADSSEVRVGDFVVAIGNPFGFSHTVTSGIVSGLGRSQVNPDPNAYEDFIQTDASINPGNSGGALVDLHGGLIGINSAILSRSGGNIGIGFAIPVNMAREIMDQLAEHGEVRRGLLGVRVRRITPEIADTYGLPNTSGALVAAVSMDSAAEDAGITIDDIIVSVDGMSVRDPGSLRNAIGLKQPGDEVRVGLIRDGTERTITAVLGSLAAGAGAPMR